MDLKEAPSSRALRDLAAQMDVHRTEHAAILAMTRAIIRASRERIARTQIRNEALSSLRRETAPASGRSDM